MWLNNITLCACIIYIYIVCADGKLLQSCLTLWDPLNHSPPGSSAHGILQARILEWVAISYSRGSSWPGDQTHVFCISCIGRWIFLQYVFFSSSNKNVSLSSSFLSISHLPHFWVFPPCWTLISEVGLYKYWNRRDGRYENSFTKVTSRGERISAICLVKAMVFSEVMYGCESWTIKKAEC